MTNLIILFIVVSNIVAHAVTQNTYANYTWFVNVKGKEFEEFLVMHNSKKITFAPFKAQETEWQVATYPNGQKKHHQGSVMIYLHLKSMPSQWKQIIGSFTIDIAATYSKYTFIQSYQLFEGYGWSSANLYLKQIKKLERFTIKITITILKIILKNNEYLFERHFQFQPKYDIEWNINPQILNQIKTLNMTRWYQSNTYHDMWSMVINVDHKNGFVEAGLKLCGLPSNVYKISIKFNILCVETKTFRKFEHTFGIDESNWGTSGFVSFEEFKKQSAITLKINIEIKHLYDKDNNDILSEMKWLNKYNLQYLWNTLRKRGWNDISYWRNIDENELKEMNIRDSDRIKFKMLQQSLEKENETILDIYIPLITKLYQNNANIMNGVMIIVLTFCGWIYKRCFWKNELILSDVKRSQKVTEKIKISNKRKKKNKII